MRALRVAAALLLVAFGARAAETSADSNAKASAVDFAPPPVEPAFARGLPVVKAAAGLREANPGAVLAEWTPGLCMVIGFRTDVGSKQFVHLVEVTTLDPRAKNARGRPTFPPLDRQFVTFSGTNQFQPKPRTHVFSTLRYPVRVRLYDADGRFIKECRELLPWGYLTNGLLDACAAFRELSRLGMSATNRAAASAGMTNALSADWLNAMEIRAARGGMALGGLFAVIGDTDALDEVRSHAMSVVRPPNFLKALFELKLDLQLDPKFDQAVVLPSPGRVWFPLTLRQGQRVLTQVDFVAGSTEGAWFLTSGVRALRAAHPTKTDRRMLSQVLAVGTVPVPVSMEKPADKR